MISVAMTTYNGEKYVRKQIQSILDQSMKIDEIIIFDDGSKDNTEKIIKNFSDNRIKFKKNETNLGYIKNFYKAISSTKGDYIFLADQDDIWEPNKVKKMIEIMSSNECSLLCTNFELIDEEDNQLDKESFLRNNFFEKTKNIKNNLIAIDLKYLLRGNILQGATYCITRELADIFGRINYYELPHDYQLMMLAAMDNKLLFLNENLLEYRIHTNNTIGFRKRKDKINIFNFFKFKFPKDKLNFLDEVSKFKKIENLFYYKILLYLNIPSIKNKLFRTKSVLLDLIGR